MEFQISSQEWNASGAFSKQNRASPRTASFSKIFEQFAAMRRRLGDQQETWARNAKIIFASALKRPLKLVDTWVCSQLFFEKDLLEASSPQEEKCYPSSLLGDFFGIANLYAKPNAVAKCCRACIHSHATCSADNSGLNSGAEVRFSWI